MRVSASIMAHPARASYVEAMQTLLTRDGEAPVPVSWDEEGPASGNADRVWRNARAAWLMHDPGADWHLLLQDDALVCDDLLAGLSEALKHVPDRAVVSLYLGKGRLVPTRWERMANEADERGAAWIRAIKLMWGVAIVLPVPLIGSMIEHADRRAGVADDMRVAGWAERNKIDVWYPWPSLVDHLPVESLTKHRAHDRVARSWLNGSALGVDWSGPVVNDPVLVRMRGVRSGPRGTYSRATSRASVNGSEAV